MKSSIELWPGLRCCYENEVDFGIKAKGKIFCLFLQISYFFKQKIEQNVVVTI